MFQVIVCDRHRYRLSNSASKFPQSPGQPKPSKAVGDAVTGRPAQASNLSSLRPPNKALQPELGRDVSVNTNCESMDVTISSFNAAAVFSISSSQRLSGMCISVEKRQYVTLPLEWEPTF